METKEIIKREYDIDNAFLHNKKHVQESLIKGKQL